MALVQAGKMSIEDLRAMRNKLHSDSGANTATRSKSKGTAFVLVTGYKARPIEKGFAKGRTLSVISGICYTGSSSFSQDQLEAMAAKVDPENPSMVKYFVREETPESQALTDEMKSAGKVNKDNKDYYKPGQNPNPEHEVYEYGVGSNVTFTSMTAKLSVSATKPPYFAQINDIVHTYSPEQREINDKGEEVVYPARTRSSFGSIQVIEPLNQESVRKFLAWIPRKTCVIKANPASGTTYPVVFKKDFADGDEQLEDNSVTIMEFSNEITPKDVIRINEKTETRFPHLAAEAEHTQWLGGATAENMMVLQLEISFWKETLSVIACTPEAWERVLYRYVKHMPQYMFGFMEHRESKVDYNGNDDAVIKAMQKKGAVGFEGVVGMVMNTVWMDMRSFLEKYGTELTPECFHEITFGDEKRHISVETPKDAQINERDRLTSIINQRREQTGVENAHERDIDNTYDWCSVKTGSRERLPEQEYRYFILHNANLPSRDDPMNVNWYKHYDALDMDQRSMLYSKGVFMCPEDGYELRINYNDNRKEIVPFRMTKQEPEGQNDLSQDLKDRLTESFKSLGSTDIAHLRRGAETAAKKDAPLALPPTEKVPALPAPEPKEGAKANAVPPTADAAPAAPAAPAAADAGKDAMQVDEPPKEPEKPSEPPAEPAAEATTEPAATEPEKEAEKPAEPAKDDEPSQGTKRAREDEETNGDAPAAAADDVEPEADSKAAKKARKEAKKAAKKAKKEAKKAKKKSKKAMSSDNSSESSDSS